MQLATGYWASATLSAGVEIGLFDALGEEAHDAQDLAAATGTSRDHLLRLLEALASLGVLTRSGESFAIAPDLREFLCPDRPTSLLDALRFNIDLYPLWSRLGTSVREGKPAIPPTAHLGNDPARTERFVRGMHSRAMMLAPAVVDAIDLSGVVSMLDLACGPGAFSRFLLAKHPALKSTLFDLTPVLDVAERLLYRAPESQRITFHPGDYRRDVLPAPFDAIFYCGALHQETPESAGRLFAKIRASLRPGGRVIVVDLMLQDDRAGPAFSALFSLNMMLTSPAGRVFSEAETIEILSTAGFIDVRRTPTGRSPYSIIEASI